MLVTLRDCFFYQMCISLSNVLLAVITQQLQILVHKVHVMQVHLQDSVVVLYNWLKRDTLSPHTWVTDYMNDLALPVNFVGLSTEDRRFIYPQKEVINLQAVRMHKQHCSLCSGLSVIRSHSGLSDTAFNLRHEHFIQCMKIKCTRHVPAGRFFGESSLASASMLDSSYCSIYIIWYLLFCNMLPSLLDSQPREVAAHASARLLCQPKLL